MARYKGDPANTGWDAGDTFNYEVWTAETELTLCNVRWDAIYKDVYYPDSTDELNSYIDARGDITTIRNASYARVDEPVLIDMPFGAAQKYNYIRVFNPAQPVKGGDVPKYYYYFIRDIRHRAPNTTEIVVQLDVWQTYIRLVQFGRAYIDRGHIGIANERNFSSYGREYLTIPEGLDIGADYVTIASKSVKIMDPFANSGEPTFNVMAISTVDLNGDHGTEERPKNPSARPTLIQSGVPSGAGVYVWDSAADFMAFMRDYSKKPWVTAGIVSITLLPPWQRYSEFGSGKWTGSEKNTVTRARAGYIAPDVRRDLYPNWRNSADILNYIPARYRHLKKFLTSPYCLLQMTFNAGSAVTLKPESWNSPNASIVEKVSIIPPDQRVAAIPLNYNGRNPTKPMPSEKFGYTEWTRDGDYLDMAVFLTGFPTIPIVNNGQIMYLASNARSIAAQYSSNDWAQQRALAGNQASFDQATAGINAGSDLANNSMSADAQQTAIQQQLASQQALLNLFGGTASGAGMGAFAGPLGAVAGGVGGAVSGGLNMLSTGMQADASNQALAARMNTAGNARDINSGLGRTIRDSNKGLADWAAKGDYANARAGMDAKIQDAQMTPHGMSGQFGGETFNLVKDDANLVLRIKMIDQAAIAVTGEYWLRYGYPVRRSARIPNDLRVMTKFSYWKMSEVYIINAAMPENHKQTLRGILEKGVTVWTNPDDIGVIDFADNQPLPGIVIEGYNPPEWEPEPDPEPPVKIKRRKRKMLVYGTNDSGMKWALAGTSPGTEANFIKTDSQVLADQFMEACGVTEPVMLTVSDFYEYEIKYLAPVSTFEYVEGA